MTESNKQIVAVGKNIQDKAALIWNVVNSSKRGHMLRTNGALSPF